MMEFEGSLEALREAPTPRVENSSKAGYSPVGAGVFDSKLVKPQEDSVEPLPIGNPSSLAAL